MAAKPLESNQLKQQNSNLSRIGNLIARRMHATGAALSCIWWHVLHEAFWTPSSICFHETKPLIVCLLGHGMVASGCHLCMVHSLLNRELPGRPSSPRLLPICLAQHTTHYATTCCCNTSSPIVPVHCFCACQGNHHAIQQTPLHSPSLQMCDLFHTAPCLPG